MYDVAHNIAKFERYEVEGQETELCVHRKGATRAFPAGHPDVPHRYREVGQPVLVPGDMGRYSFVCGPGQGHAGDLRLDLPRRRPRAQPRRGQAPPRRGQHRSPPQRQGIQVRAQSKSGLAEESSEAYKDVQDVVHVLQDAGIANVVAQLRPLGVIKG